MLLRPAVAGWLRNHTQENRMTAIDYIGLDIHKKTISFCANAHDRRSVAVQSAAGVLHGALRDPRFAAGVALSQFGGAAGDADEEPHRWSVDGDWNALQQRTTARQDVLQRIVREFAGSASLSGGTAQAESGTVGVLR